MQSRSIRRTGSRSTLSNDFHAAPRAAVGCPPFALGQADGWAVLRWSLFAESVNFIQGGQASTVGILGVSPSSGTDASQNLTGDALAALVRHSTALRGPVSAEIRSEIVACGVEREASDVVRGPRGQAKGPCSSFVTGSAAANTYGRARTTAATTPMGY